MTRITDKCIILLCCCAFFIIGSPSDSSVVVLLIAISFSCINSCFDKKPVTIGISILYSLLSCFIPEFSILLPLLVYDVIDYKDSFLYLVFLPAFGKYIAVTDLRNSLLLALTLTLSYFIFMRSYRLSGLQSKYFSLMDNSREINLKLEAKNTDLMEKQDYEIHVATLQERNRIAREIHDNVGHMLSRSILQVGAMMAINQNPDFDETLGSLKETLNTAMNNIRESVHDLYDESIDLHKAVNDIVEDFKYCPVSFDYDMNPFVSKMIKYCFISIIKEALTNISKHSDATTATIVLREHPALYQLLIEDNGHVQASIDTEGIGLKNMRTRVEALRGTFITNTNQGFRIFVTIPKTIVSEGRKP